MDTVVMDTVVFVLGWFGGLLLGVGLCELHERLRRVEPGAGPGGIGPYRKNEKPVDHVEPKIEPPEWVFVEFPAQGKFGGPLICATGHSHPVDIWSDDDGITWHWEDGRKVADTGAGGLVASAKKAWNAKQMSAKIALAKAQKTQAS